MEGGKPWVSLGDNFEAHADAPAASQGNSLRCLSNLLRDIPLGGGKPWVSIGEI